MTETVNTNQHDVLWIFGAYSISRFTWVVL